MTAIKAKPSRPYTEIFLYFLKLGVLGFGGPFAIMAAIQKELIESRRWMSSEHFARALALIKALPGPVATQLTIYLGFVRGGRIGGLIAGIALIAPSFFMMLTIAAFYNSIGQFSWTRPVLFGMQAAAIGVIIDSVWKLARPYKIRISFWVIAVLAGALTFWRPSSEPLVIIGAGILGTLALRFSSRGGILAQFLPPLAASGPVIVLPLLATLAGVSLKAGAFVFGSGLAIVPMLAHDVVDVHKWLTHQQFMDALSFGQITPGPVVITATFIGYKVAGFVGALVATVGVFAPAFINILTWFPIAEKKLSKSPYTPRFVAWAIAAVVGSIALAVAKLAIATSAENNGSPLIFAGMIVATLVVMLKTKAPVWVIIPAGGLLAAIFSLLG